MRHSVRFTALIPASALTSLMALALGWQVQAQTLTPGAAAIGGTTGNGELIGPGGGSSSGSSSSSTSSTSSSGSSSSTPRRNPRIHYASNSWPLPLPPERTQVRGQPISAFDPAGSEPAPQTAEASDQGTDENTGSAPSNDQNTDTNNATSVAGLTPVFDPNAQPAVDDTAATDTPDPLANQPSETPSEPAPLPEPEPEPAQATSNTDTNAVTSGATDANAPAPETDTNLAPSGGDGDFRMTALNFGSESITLSDAHIGQLQPVINLMRAQPDTPLRVVAILAQAQANSEDAKLTARRRILAVRRHLLDQGLSADNLTFVISSNASSEQFADHVLIQR